MISSLPVKRAFLRPRVVVFSELYWPEDTSTGFFVTGIAEGLAEDREVLVFCAQPTYRRRGIRAPRRERRRGVEIARVFSTTFGHEGTLGRALNSVSVAVALFLHAIRRLRPTDQVLVVTNPPLLPYLIVLAARVRRARAAVLVHDVYPEALEATGVVPVEGLVAGVVRKMARWLYHRASRIVVLGRDMATLVSRHVEGASIHLVVIPNWCDVEEIKPAPRTGNALLTRLRLDDAFVVQWLGNMGRTHAIESLMRAAATLTEHRDVHFLFVGWGAKRAWLQKAIAERALDNVTLLPPCERDELSTHLAACDLAVVALLPGMAGVSVPSRLYNILASGRPLLAVAEPESELATMVREERLGWTVPPADPEEIAAAILSAAATEPALRAQMAVRARHLAEGRYSRDTVIRSWKALFADDWRR